MNVEYFINFDTSKAPEAIEATRVTLDFVTITDMKRKLSINLCDHPLYKDLVAYVKANPAR